MYKLWKKIILYWRRKRKTKTAKGRTKKKHEEELKQRQKQYEEAHKYDRIDSLYDEEMKKINNEYDNVFSKYKSSGYKEGAPLKSLKPKFKIMSKDLYNKKNGKIEIPNCSICLQKIKSGQMIYLLPCKHLLHNVCGDSWFKNKTECPYCRRYVYYTPW